MPPDRPSTAMNLMAKFSRGKADQVKAIDRLVERCRVMTRLFMTKDGVLSPDAEWFFADVAWQCSFFEYGFEPDARFQDHMTGQRALLSEILKGFHIDAIKMHHLKSNLERKDL